MFTNAKFIGSSLWVIVVLTFFMTASEVSAEGKCRAVDAEQNVTVINAGTTAGTIRNGGILNGTTSDQFTSLPTATPDPDTISLTDTLTITTNAGTLVGSDVTIFDTTHGIFSAISRISGGTGIFSGSTGTLFISGSTLDGVHFNDRIMGEICFSLN
jgi:hypothetical protein